MISVRIQVQVNDTEYEITERDPLSTFSQVGQADLAVVIMNQCAKKITAAIGAR